MISSRETSSSPGSFNVIGSKSLGIRDKRIRRPGAIYFDAAEVLPPSHKLTQNFVPLLAAAARNQERCLPDQAGLCPAHLAAGRSITCHFFQRCGKFLYFRIITLRALLDLRRFLLQIFPARPR